MLKEGRGESGRKTRHTPDSDERADWAEEGIGDHAIK